MEKEQNNLDYRHGWHDGFMNCTELWKKDFAWLFIYEELRKKDRSPDYLKTLLGLSEEKVRKYERSYQNEINETKDEKKKWEEIFNEIDAQYL